MKTTDIEIALKDFKSYCAKHIKGDEKGEANIFLDHLFTALGYPEGLKGAGAECEFRIRNEEKKTTSFADLVWKPRVLIEMKKRDEDLTLHLQQAFTYWTQLVPNRPKYVMLCNFDEFWIYDFDKDIYEPQEKLFLAELDTRYHALTFLFPEIEKPVFGKDRENVTEKAAEKIAAMFNSMVKRRIPREDALRYCLQCIIAMFAEDVGLLPDKIFTRLIEECIERKANNYDLIGGLFRTMNEEGETPAGRYKGVEYFNGGIFEKIIAIELTEQELSLLDVATWKNWRHVNPAIFGTG